MYVCAGNNPITYTDPDGRFIGINSSLRLDTRNIPKISPSTKIVLGIALTMAGHLLDKGCSAIASAVAVASGGTGAVAIILVGSGCKVLGRALEAAGVALAAQGALEMSAEIADEFASQIHFSSNDTPKKGYREKTRNANANDRKQVDSVASKFKINRRDFGDFIEQTKLEMGRGPSDNFSYSELEDLAREFMELN